MDQVTYERWWALHLRVARREGLSAEDQTFHENMRRQLEQEEVLGGQSLDLLKVHAAVTSLEAERSALEERRQQLDAEIADLEGKLTQQTQQPLGVKG